ncbi:MAG: hypothetical protein MI864_22650 [Pseudomonadales bacterium]|nr:hypothetical protein [Pseudomonadales bacterium]
MHKYADTSELKHILMHCREGIDGDIAIGAQYLSEIQGGSDVQANRIATVWSRHQDEAITMTAFNN